MKYPKINNKLFKFNREKFKKHLPEHSLAVFHSNDKMPSSGDVFFKFKQNADLFYLTGINQEESILILYPDAPNQKFREILFIRENNEYIAVWDGDRLTKEDATDISGIKNIYWLNDFDTIFSTLMSQAQKCFVNLNEHPRFSTPVNYLNKRFANHIRENYPGHEIRRSAPILCDIRSIKHEIEIELIQKACDITTDAFKRVLKFVSPGVSEYEIEAEITHEFIRQGADGHAYHPIIASGKNACVLHYNSNNRNCKDGDLILFDFGASYTNYTSDMSRTIPVNGKYTDRQRAVYNAVLNVFKEARKMLRPGVLLEEYHKEVGKLMEKELIQLKLLTAAEVRKQNPDIPLYKKYFMHGTSHYLGLDVHDVGNPYLPIKEGMVFTCEPGIYIRDENIGIRLENDILITKNDPVDLLSNSPIEADHIEEVMNKQFKSIV